METDKIIRELGNVIEKHKGAVLSTFETSIELMARDCLDKIRELQAEVDRLKAEREWVPVGELPKNTAIVLITDGRDIFTGFYFEKKWHESNGYILKNITHWQPLPQPPEGT